MIVDIAKARATIARMRLRRGCLPAVEASTVADEWSSALDALESATELADAGERAVDVLEDQGTRAVTMLRDFIALLPDKALRRDKVTRDDFPELFGTEDGNALYLDEARHRILAKVQP